MMLLLVVVRSHFFTMNFTWSSKKVDQGKMFSADISSYLLQYPIEPFFYT
jgi:hypothetical protein